MTGGGGGGAMVGGGDVGGEGWRGWLLKSASCIS